eukprot:gene18964-26851_t
MPRAYGKRGNPPGGSGLEATRGRYTFQTEDYTIGAVPDRLTLAQGGLPLEIRDFNVEGRPRLPAEWLGPDARWRIFKVISQASLDPSQPLDFSLSVTRAKAQQNEDGGHHLHHDLGKRQIGRREPKEREAYAQPGATQQRQCRQPVVFGLPGCRHGAQGTQQPQQRNGGRAAPLRPPWPAQG